MLSLDQILTIVPQLALGLVIIWVVSEQNKHAREERKEYLDRFDKDRRESDERTHKFWSEQRALDREMGLRSSEMLAGAISRLSESFQALSSNVSNLYIQGRETNAALSRVTEELQGVSNQWKKFIGGE